MKKRDRSRSSFLVNKWKSTSHWNHPTKHVYKGSRNVGQEVGLFPVCSRDNDVDEIKEQIYILVALF